MGNVMPAKYIYQLAPMADVKLAIEIRALSYATGDSMSVVARKLMEERLAQFAAGGAIARGDWPEVSDEVRAEAAEYIEDYAARQLTRRRNNNADQRAAAQEAKPKPAKRARKRAAAAD